MDHSHPAGALLRCGAEEDLSQGNAHVAALCGFASPGLVHGCAGTGRHTLISQEARLGERMLARLKQMLIKEFIHVFRDKRARAVLFGPPIIQMLVFGYAATFEIRHVPTAILDLDHSQESRDLVSRFST